MMSVRQAIKKIPFFLILHGFVSIMVFICCISTAWIQISHKDGRQEFYGLGLWKICFTKEYWLFHNTKYAIFRPHLSPDCQQTAVEEFEVVLDENEIDISHMHPPIKKFNINDLFKAAQYCYYNAFVFSIVAASFKWKDYCKKKPDIRPSAELWLGGMLGVAAGICCSLGIKYFEACFKLPEELMSADSPITWCWMYYLAYASGMVSLWLIAEPFYKFVSMKYPRTRDHTYI